VCEGSEEKKSPRGNRGGGGTYRERRKKKKREKRGGVSPSAPWEQETVAWTAGKPIRGEKGTMFSEIKWRARLPELLLQKTLAL